MSHIRLSQLIKLRVLAIVLIALATSLTKPQTKADAWFGGGIAVCMWQYATCQDHCYNSACGYTSQGFCAIYIETCLDGCQDQLVNCFR